MSWSKRQWRVALLVATSMILVLLAFGALVLQRSCWNPGGTRHGQVAYAFARALASGDYATARGMLSSELAGRLDEDALRAEYEGMIEYGGGPASGVRIIVAMDVWPGRQPGDIGWAYAAVSGEGFSEAVTVIVTHEGDWAVIREIEWGRP